jgi:hypothetical protein
VQGHPAFSRRARILSYGQSFVIDTMKCRGLIDPGCADYADELLEIAPAGLIATLMAHATAVLELVCKLQERSGRRSTGWCVSESQRTSGRLFRLP